MHIRTYALTFVASTALAGCAGTSSKTEFEYWVIDLAKPNEDIVLLIDGEPHPLPVAIPMTDETGQWQSRRISDARVESTYGPYHFVVESRSGQAIAWDTDLLYSSSSQPITGIKYSVFLAESDKQFVRDQWVQPDADSLLTDIENGHLPRISP